MHGPTVRRRVNIEESPDLSYFVQIVKSFATGFAYIYIHTYAFEHQTTIQDFEHFLRV